MVMPSGLYSSGAANFLVLLAALSVEISWPLSSLRDELESVK